MSSTYDRYRGQHAAEPEPEAAAAPRCRPWDRHRAPVRHPGIHLAVLVPDRRRVHRHLRPGSVRHAARIDQVLGRRGVRRPAVRVRPGPRAESFAGGARVRAPGAPHHAVPARRVFRDRARAAHARLRVPDLRGRAAGLACAGGRLLRPDPRDLALGRRLVLAGLPARLGQPRGGGVQPAARAAPGRRPDAAGRHLEGDQAPRDVDHRRRVGRACDRPRPVRPGPGSRGGPAVRRGHDQRGVAGRARRLHVDRGHPGHQGDQGP
jgi:hypothetical protein